jgi:hypothetical protein
LIFLSCGHWLNDERLRRLMCGRSQTFRPRFAISQGLGPGSWAEPELKLEMPGRPKAFRTSGGRAANLYAVFDCLANAEFSKSFTQA